VLAAAAAWLRAGAGAAGRARGCSQLSAAAAGQGGHSTPGVNLASELKKEFLFWEK